MASKQNNNNIKKYRKPLNLNVGILIFAVILFYVIYSVIMYFKSGHVVRYEIKEGSIAVNNIYKAIAIRDEQVVNAERAGYINFYAYEGERVAFGDLVYTVDETGRLSEQLKEIALEDNTLTDKELKEFRADIVNFMHGYSNDYYSSTYEFKRTLQNTLLRLANVNVLKSIQNLNAESGSGNVVGYNKAPTTGIVTFWTDGYESLTPEMVTEEMFDSKEKYEKKQLLSNELIASGDPAYKISTNERWSIVIPVEPERGVELEKEGYIKVKFLKNQYEAWGSTKLLRNSDGNTYLQLSFTNSMVTYVKDRFLDVELLVQDEKGLKIPVSSIVEKEFFLIGEEYVTEGNGKDKYRIIRQCYKEDGSISSEELNVNVYSFDEDTHEYYLDASILNAGDVLIKIDGQETFTVSKRATLIGVYNMNKGYADFKEINILSQNEEYAIVKANTRYGLNVYDYIVLDASTVKDDQFINE